VHERRTGVPSLALSFVRGGGWLGLGVQCLWLTAVDAVSRFYRVQGRILSALRRGDAPVDDESSSTVSAYKEALTPWLTLYQGRAPKTVLGGFFPGHRSVLSVSLAWFRTHSSLTGCARVLRVLDVTIDMHFASVASRWTGRRQASGVTLCTLRSLYHALPRL